MRKVSVKQGSKGHAILSNLAERRTELRQRFIDKLPPQEIRKFMVDEAEKVNTLNDGMLDKSDFRLGMLSLWFYLEKNYEMKKKIILEHPPTYDEGEE